MADIKTEIVQARLLTDHALELFALGELDYETASMAKLYTTEAAVRNSSKLLQLFGGWGYMWEYPVAKTFAGTRVMVSQPFFSSEIYLQTIYAGTSEIMRELISRSIYRK